MTSRNFTVTVQERNRDEPCFLVFETSSLLKKVFEVSRWATLIQDPSARRTKDSQPSGFGFEYCASHVRFRVFQQTASVE